ncbi:hypothetical protein PV749_23685 [Streptomyces sp. ID03-2B]|uniref:hypothetical protein n=1 Tax=Streptomyces sp. ID03-2B TaxID=3028660 RepID=UPI0029B5C147|nr:hypothetical protein [Streptomyces sp. ID03-2B]MDX3594124.1 hypothetical protein [Streptomyces sp. ID03-2B]
MSEPLVAADLFRTVMEAAGGRCQCTGQCGQPHAKTDRRCPREHDSYAGRHRGPVRLMAAAADLTLTEREAAALPADRLRAWCPGCFTETRRSRRTTEPAAEQGGLFDL